MPDIAELEELFHRQIPITRAMGIRVAEWNGTSMTLRAPLDANHNHLNTAFGGSINAVATLAGYALLWMLQDTVCHIVIRESSIAFLRPIRKELVAVCRRPSDEAVAEFMSSFSRRQKGRIVLDVTLQEDGLEAATFRGTFVALGEAI